MPTLNITVWRRAARTLVVAVGVTGVAAAAGGAAAVAGPVPVGSRAVSMRPPAAGSAAAAALLRAHGLAAPRRFPAVPGYHAARVAPPPRGRPLPPARAPPPPPPPHPR